MEKLPSVYVDRGEERNNVLFGGSRAACFIKKVVAGEGEGKKYSSFGYDFIMELHRRICSPFGTDSFLRQTDTVTVGGEPIKTSYLSLDYKFRAYCYWLEEQMKLLKDDPYNLIHGLEVAAAAHYGLTSPELLHPFDNGNGRTARALVNTILMSQSYELITYRLAVPPVPILRSPTKGADRYIKTLRAIKETGTLNPFMTFLAQRWSENLRELLGKIHQKIENPKQSDKQLIAVLEQRLYLLEEVVNTKEQKYQGGKSGTMKISSHQIYQIPDYIPSRFTGH